MPLRDSFWLLRGARTSAPVLYAESLIALDRLDARIRHGLLTTEQPIGRLIRDNRLETFRELLSCEELGLCAKGDAGRMIAERRTDMDGPRPVNPSGRRSTSSKCVSVPPDTIASPAAARVWARVCAFSTTARA